MLSVTFSTFWLLYTDFRTLNTEIDIIVTFWPANILFMVVGVLVIFEVFQSMKKEFEEIKEKQKRVKLDK
jgi:putative Mn2+ efflux pump MntP